METIEPIHFEIEGRGLDIDNEFPRSREWNQTKLHLLDTAVSDFCDPINDNKLRKKYMKVFESELEQVTEILPNFGQTTPPGLEVPSIPGTVYLHDNSFIVPNMNEDGIMYIISNNKNKARTLRDDVIRELKEKTEVVKGAGVDSYGIYSGDEFAKYQLESIESVSSIDFGEPDDFESEIYDVVSPISEAFVHNVTVDFNEVPQNREYDLLLLTAPETKLHISVKDYSGVDDSPTADDLIHNPRNQATLIGADMTYSVVKGVDDLSPFLKEVELRDDINICEKQNCHDKIRKFIQDEFIIRTLAMMGMAGLNISFG